jgi:hypothetical protein
MNQQVTNAATAVTQQVLAWILRETRCDTGLEWRKCLSCKE